MAMSTAWAPSGDARRHRDPISTTQTRDLRRIDSLGKCVNVIIILVISLRARDAKRGQHPPTWDGYPLGSYRIATAPEPNSSRLTSFKSRSFDSPANNVGPWR